MEPTGASLTRPLGLERHLARPRRWIDPVPFLDVCMIVAFFGFNSSMFIFGGVGIDLPSVGEDLMEGVPTNAVLTVRVAPSDGRVEPTHTFLFDGQILRSEQLGAALRAFVRQGENPRPVLLVKADRTLSLEKLLEVCERAREAGFVSVQPAVDERGPVPLPQRADPGPGGARGGGG